MTEKTVSILLIEDNPGDTRLIREMLAEAGPARFELESTGTLASGLKRAASEDVDIILLDLSLPDSSGLATLSSLEAEAPRLPIVVLSGLDDEDLALKAVRMGAQDYLIKGRVDPDLLERCIHYAIERKQSEEELKRRTHALDERVKKLNCLYGILQLAAAPGISFADILRRSVDLLPTAWQYPEITCARILLAGMEFKTERFKETAWKQTSRIVVNGDEAGSVEVSYLEERPEKDEGPFSREERGLIDAVAEHLARVLERMQAERGLHEAENKYRTIFELSPMAIVLLDPKGRLTDLNDRVHDWLGYEKEEVLGKTLIQLPFLTLKSRLRAVRRFLQRMLGKDVPPYQLDFVTKSGERRIGTVVGTPIRDERGGIIGSLAMLSDDTEKKEMERALEDWRRKLEGLHEAARRLEVSDNEEEACQLTVDAAQETLGFALCSLDIVQGNNLVVKATSSQLPQAASTERSIDSAGLAGRTYRTGATVVFGSPEEVPDADPTQGDFLSGISAPIGDVGVFQAVSRQPDAFSQEDVRLLELLLGYTHQALARVRLQDELREQAIHDALTGVYNRHHFAEMIGQELNRSSRYRHAIGFLMIDIDGFKGINDTLGHQTGDLVLREVAALLQAQVRLMDTVVRYGGDEFLIVLPETGGQVAEARERVLGAVARWNESSELLDFPLTLSIGSACWAPGDDESIAQVLARADHNMYQEKNNHRAAAGPLPDDSGAPTWRTG